MSFRSAGWRREIPMGSLTFVRDDKVNFVLKLRSPERSGTTSSHSEQSRETLQR